MKWTSGRSMRHARHLVVLGVAALAVALVGDVAGARDFRPFLMTIEQWDAEAESTSDGRKLPRTEVYRLEYWDRRNWTLTRIDDPKHVDRFAEGRRCRAGRHHAYDTQVGWRPISDDPAFCNGVPRWIHWGMAWHYGWARTDGPLPGQVTYTDPGERVVFDVRTGLPLLYEAGRAHGPVLTRDVYRLERYLAD
jgi:hypothetical protein